MAGYTLRDDVAKDAARMLLMIAHQGLQPARCGQYFEVLKEKAPELVIPFDEIRSSAAPTATSASTSGPFWSGAATTEASYLEDARVGEVLRQRGKTLEGIAFLLDLWREYPETASIRATSSASRRSSPASPGKAIDRPGAPPELADAGVTRSDLLLAVDPPDPGLPRAVARDPLADEASLALVGAFLELEDYEAVVKLSRRYAKLYPKSTFLDSFQYSRGAGPVPPRPVRPGHRRGRDDRHGDVQGRRTASTSRARTSGRPSTSSARSTTPAASRPEALDYYEQVADRFTDAAGAVKALTRKELKLPEVSVVRPAARRGGRGRRRAPRRPRAAAGAEDGPKDEPAASKLDYRNIAEADVKVYPVDLMRLYLTRRNLDGIAGIDLAGITPLVETTIKLGDGRTSTTRSARSTSR